MFKPMLAGVLALSLGACMVVNVDEGSVFHPVAFNTALAEKTGEAVVGETAYTSPEAWATVWASRASVDKGFPKQPAPYVAASVEHGRFDTGEGGLAYTLVKRADAADTLVVRCGGNASTRQRSGYLYSIVAAPYGDVLLFDYPGYGETGGEASAARFQQMADELVALVRDKAGDRKIVLWGHSLGGLVCSELAARLPETDGMIIETSVRNAREAAQSWTPWYAALFVRVDIAESLGGFDIVTALKGFSGPVLVLGGEKDDTLSVHLSRSLNAALKEEGVAVEYVEFKGGGHSDLYRQPDFTTAVAGLFSRVNVAK